MISDERARGRYEALDALRAVLRTKTNPRLIAAIEEDVRAELAELDARHDNGGTTA